MKLARPMRRLAMITRPRRQDTDKELREHGKADQIGRPIGEQRDKGARQATGNHRQDASASRWRRNTKPAVAPQRQQRRAAHEPGGAWSPVSGQITSSSQTQPISIKNSATSSMD